ncbi:hypothetical protein FNV43_RR26093 [Rhamnella rubrinervis]|uniref:TIR domain-containing protein n=1 Tax=Rhamnella rubrinervis TaxID=2594499 RepID=A0A8K0DUB7_9ROSA|nr:hypothetical protein FNV43_RR26093 [Rhamnella rubrinervis]
MANNDDVSSTPAPVAFRFRWDVFLSFRGEDTRETITKNIHDSLLEHGVRVFLDNEGLNRGDEIDRSLLDAIEDSAACVVVFSPRYADSRWCLEELARIWENRRLILPVFYGVDPSHVRRQGGPFEENFRIHEGKFGKEKVLRWREAMEKVGGISGFNFWVFKNSEETEKIQSLVKRVLKEISNTPVGVAPYTVGLESRIENLMKLVDVKSNGIRVIGLHGMGGVGKTTLAKALFNKLAGHFQLRSFMSNVREISTEADGLISLRSRLMDDLSKSKLPTANEVSAGMSEIEERGNDNRVLVVLDDVDDISQLNALFGKGEWFGEGSRIFITTRDREVLRSHLVTDLYQVGELDSSEALQLFSYHALRREKPTDNFLKLSKQIVSLTGGLPLAVEVFGSLLFDKRRIEEWKDALEKLKKISPHNLQDVLKISYDVLDEEEKCIFLDIACIFLKMEMKREHVIYILKGCGFEAEIAITDLTAKSLIKITEDNTLWMHDQVRDMGRQIVRQENLIDPCMRSRLWERDGIMTVFQDDKREKCVQGIVLDLKRKSMVKDPDGGRISWESLRRTPNFTSTFTYLKERYKDYVQNQEERKREFVISSKSFGTMPKLRLLQIDYVNIEGKVKSLPAELKWLQWNGCTLKFLPSDFGPQGLSVLDLSHSKIKRVWDSYKAAEKLMVLNLSGCHNLAATPDLSGNQALEKIILDNCVGLVKVHESLGNLNTLLHLSMRSCSNLIKLPSDVSGLKRLENLILAGCLKLKELPESIGSMESLKELLVDETAIENLPESIFRLTQLEKLSLNNCRHLKRLPQCIGKLCSLKEVSLNGSGLEELPDSMGLLANLEKLRVMWCSSLTVLPDSIGDIKSLTEFSILGSPIKEIPACVGSLPNLKDLSIGKGQAISKLPDEIERLDSIVVLAIDETSITSLPDKIGELKLLEKLEMRKCRHLRSLPESIGYLMRLSILVLYEASITELPESIGMLENLIMLRMNNCKNLFKLPASIGNLKSLHRLLMSDTAVTELPESFGMLSSLMTLQMAKKPQVEVPYNGEAAGKRISSSQVRVMLPTSFSNLSLLNDFDARGWNICGKIPDDFEKLSSLETLKLGHNHFCSLPSSLRGLSILKYLLLPHCKELKCLPPLPASLIVVNVANCTALEYISDISNLESLEELNVANCNKVQDIPGLEFLKSLKRLYMSCCSSCSLVVRKRLSKCSLRKIRNLSMPGSRIPEWFSQDVVKFSERRNHAIKGVIIGAVVSLSHQIPDDWRDHLPGIVDIQAKILKLDFPIFTSVFNLAGVPNSDEDQLHLCRYSSDHPLVSQLKDGYKIQVTKRDPPVMKGVELKKYGVYLVYEGDDDYEGEEESLKGSQQSISEKLAKFFNNLEEDDEYASDSKSSDEVISQVQEIETREHTSSSGRNYFSFSFFALSFIILLFAWFYSSNLYTR